MTELAEYVPINLISLFVLGALGLRRLVLMEGFHELRVAVLTALLWVPTVYLVLLCSPLQAMPMTTSCVMSDEEPGGFTISE